MKTIFNQQIKPTRVIFATFLILLGYMSIVSVFPGLNFLSKVMSISISFILGIIITLIGLSVVFTFKKTLFIFSKPINPVKNTIKYFLICWVFSTATLLLLTTVFGLQLAGDPTANLGLNPLLFLLTPISIMVEELISIYFLSIFTSKFSVTISSILCAIIFGLLHYPVYFNGNLITTLVHIIFVQGSSRIILNQAAIKSNSLWTSWIVHVLFDFSTTFLILLLLN